MAILEVYFEQFLKNKVLLKFLTVLWMTFQPKVVSAVRKVWANLLSSYPNSSVSPLTPIRSNPNPANIDSVCNLVSVTDLLLEQIPSCVKLFFCLREGLTQKKKKRVKMTKFCPDSPPKCEILHFFFFFSSET